MSREKIKRFLELQNKVIKDLCDFEEYILINDLEIINDWDSAKCDEIWDIIVKRVVNNDFIDGLDGKINPFCIECDYDCCSCMYGKNHGVCDEEEFDTYSQVVKALDTIKFDKDLVKLIVLHIEGNITGDKFLSHYKALIHRAKLLGKFEDIVLDLKEYETDMYDVVYFKKLGKALIDKIITKNTD